VGDCLLTSSFLSYTGAFTFYYRHAMVYDMWNKDVSERKIPLTQPCELPCSVLRGNSLFLCALAVCSPA
jgi:hypothetical protein